MDVHSVVFITGSDRLCDQIQRIDSQKTVNLHTWNVSACRFIITPDLRLR